MCRIKTWSNHDNVKLELKFPTGGILKWSVTRNRETLTVGFSNDPAIGKKQAGTVGLWFGRLKGTYEEKLVVATEFLVQCDSGAEVIEKMEADLARIN